ncbi:MAG: YncE family protein [Nitriliruptorales bacterium]
MRTRSILGGSKAVVLAVLALGLAACTAAAEQPEIEGEIWVANPASDDVRVYDGTTFERLATISLPGQTPYGLEVHPGGGEVWVVNIEGNSVWVVDTQTREIVAKIEGDDVVEAPVNLRFSEDGSHGYLVGGEGFLTVIDTTSYEVTHQEIAGFGPHGLWQLPDGTLRTANRTSDDVSILQPDGAQVTFVDNFPAAPTSYDVVAPEDASVLYVSSRGWHAVTVLRTEDHSILGAIPVGEDPAILGIAAAENRLFVANTGDSTVSMIDLATFEQLGADNRRIGDVVAVGDQVGSCDGCVEPVVDRWEDQPVSGEVVSITSEGVVLRGGGEVFAVPQNVLLGLPGGLAPHGIEVTEDGRYVLVTFTASDDVFVYEAATGRQVAWLHGCEEEPAADEPGCNPGANDVAIVPR